MMNTDGIERAVNRSAVGRYSNRDEPVRPVSRTQDTIPSTTGLQAAYSPSQLRSRYAAVMSSNLTAPSLNRSLVDLNEAEQSMVRRLEERDQIVRLHEARHVAALGALAGVTRFVFQVGPDGRSYAVGGSVEVNAMPSSSPEATVAKARILRTAALAGGEPSGADFAMAVEAQRMERSARVRLQA